MRGPVAYFAGATTSPLTTATHRGVTMAATYDGVSRSAPQAIFLCTRRILSLTPSWRHSEATH